MAKLITANELLRTLHQTAAWHAVDAEVHHVRKDCEHGNNIEPENYRHGTGRLPHCTRCAALLRA